MKKLLIGLLALGTFSFIACNSGSDKKGTEQDMSNMKDTSKNTVDTNMQVTELTPTFSNVDPKLAVSIKTVVDHYLHIKNALVNDNGDEAANGAKAMFNALKAVDKSLLTAEQKKLYDGVEDDLKEHAEHIGDNAGKIEHQREHFSMMSEDAYDLVKAFGGGRTLYHDHCPMANDKKGGMWLSEMQQVKNPYFGGKMNECVKVMEVIK